MGQRQHHSPSETRTPYAKDLTNKQVSSATHNITFGLPFLHSQNFHKARHNSVSTASLSSPFLLLVVGRCESNYLFLYNNYCRRRQQQPHGEKMKILSPMLIHSLLLFQQVHIATTTDCSTADLHWSLLPSVRFSVCLSVCLPFHHEYIQQSSSSY